MVVSKNKIWRNTMQKQTIKIPKLKKRVIWGFNPSTKTIPSKKIYNRKKLKKIKL